MDSTEAVDEFDAFGPDNPAYEKFREMIAEVQDLEWARFEHDKNEVDITMKGIVIARFIPTDKGFRILYPFGPGYRFPMESSGDDRDGLTRQIVITRDSETIEATASIRVAHKWADSMVDDDEWSDL